MSWERSFWEKPKPPSILFEKQKELFQNYKPESPDKPLFDFANPFSEACLINEPLSLYGKPNPTNALFQKSLEEYNTIRNLRSSVKSSLNNPTGSDSASDLVSKAANVYTQNPSFFLQSEVQGPTNTANSANTEQGYLFLQESFLSNLQQSAELSPWTHPIRTELAYAASHVSPLVPDMDGDGIKLFPYTQGVYFDIDNDGFKERVGWPSPGDGQLARDINQNGKIDDITELFGDDRDEAFNELLIWQDKSSNGFSKPEELYSFQTLAAGYSVNSVDKKSLFLLTTVFSYLILSYSNHDKLNE